MRNVEETVASIRRALAVLPQTGPWTAGIHWVGCAPGRDVCHVDTCRDFGVDDAERLVAYLVACQPQAMRALLERIERLEAAHLARTPCSTDQPPATKEQAACTPP